MNLKHEMNLEFESGFMPIKDDLYIKIFIGRNQEYDSKFYSWKWDFLRKKGGLFTRAGINMYSPVRYGKTMANNVSEDGIGMGEEGAPDYFMVFYRYVLE